MKDTNSSEILEDNISEEVLLADLVGTEEA